MSSSIRLSVWNAKGAPELQPERSAEFIKRELGDITFVAEATDGAIPERTLDALDKNGLEVVAAFDRDPNDTRRYTNCAVIADRGLDSIVETEELQIGSRFASMISIDGIRMLLTHLDDQSEQSRVTSAEAIAALAPDSIPDIVAGVLDIVPPETTRASMLRSPVARKIAERVPIDRLRSLTTRLTGPDGMAAGEAWHQFEEMGYTSVDPSNTPTYRFFGVPLLPLAHILINDSVHASNFATNYAPTLSSRHSAISATLAA